jgi:CRISPR-associated protein Cas6
MNNPEVIHEMIDAVYDISGEMLPLHYHHALWHALLRHIPTLAVDEATGVIPLRTSATSSAQLLPKRAKLVVRIRAARADQFSALINQTLEVNGCKLQLSNGKLRKITPYPTLHAHLVASREDEVEFLLGVKSRLTELGIHGNLLCGMRNSLHTPEGVIQGYSLVIHDLKPDDSQRLQYAGLGADRRYGCGIFIPYKAITDLE